MVRRSDTWVFNIRQHHIQHNFDGPKDAGIHGEANIGQPWFGKTGTAQPDLREDDLIIVRRTTRGGNDPAGVVGLWRFHDCRPVEAPDEIPWTDKEYDWIIYCRPIQRRITPAFTENWNALSFSYRQFQSEVISLAPSQAYEYLRALLDHDSLSTEARQMIMQRYQLDATIDANSESVSEAASPSTESRRRTTEVDRRIRDETLVRELKELYDDTCQVCGDRRLQGVAAGYSEVHHIKPLGRPHDGPDEKSNMLVLCPNHHADFDNGVIVAAPRTHELSHLYDDSVSETLSVDEGHHPDDKYLQYHLDDLATIDVER